MKLILPTELIERLKRELRKAGSREIGGVLVGEHCQGDIFRVVDLSVQRSGGSEVHFVRDPEHNRAFLADFFSRTGNEYAKFNYLGEWHSHPLFSAVPSGKDLATMQDIVENPDVGSNFAVLLIVSLRRRQALELSVSAFRPNVLHEDVGIVLEGSAAVQQESWFGQIIDWFRS